VERREFLAPAVAMIAAAWLAAAWLEPATLMALTFDDSFYYFELARRLAADQGFTFDGIHPTNGFHPLWLAVISPLWRLGLSGEDAARAVLGSSVVLWAATAAIVARTADVAVGSWPRNRDGVDGRWAGATMAAMIALIGANPFVVRTFASGMESGLYALLYTAVLARLAVVHPLGLGGLLAVAFLARTDGALLTACIAAWCVPGAARRGARGWIALAELVALPAVTALAFMGWSQATFGTPMQISGTLKRVPLTPLRAAWFALAAGLPWLAVWRLSAPASDSRLPRTRDLLAATAPFLPFVGVIIGYYTGVQTFARLWYFGPAVLYALLLAPVFAADLLDMGLADAPDKPTAKALLPVVGLLVLPLLGGAWFQLGRFTAPEFRASREANRDAGQWISSTLPEDAVLASWDAGVLGFYTRQPVVNLDGVVNEPAYARAMIDGTTAAFLSADGITHVINHDELEGGEASMRQDAAALLGEDAVAGWKLVQTWPFTFAGSTNDASSGDHEMAVFLFELAPAAAAAPAEPPPQLAGPRRVALTLDDLPYQTAGKGQPAVDDPARWRATNAAILSSLASRQVPATVFVNCGWVGEASDLIATWQGAGFALGNHTAHHVDADRLSLDAWTDEVLSCEADLARWGSAGPHPFRYPYLRRGSTPADRDARLSALAAHGLTAAPVTVATTEWLLAAAYDDALAAGDTARAAAIGDRYVLHMREALATAHAMAHDKAGHAVDQIALAHINQLNADHLGAVIEAAQADGWTWIGLDDALDDPIYAQPDEYAGRGGISWLARVPPAITGGGSYWFGEEEARLQRWVEALDTQATSP
jgi:peptidoglycan/xylan/chitin deacetylase (PgdA/CDA1 family)